MNLSPGPLMLSLLFGAIGMGMFMFGKKTQHLVTLCAGCLLMVFPYFVGNIWLMLLIGSGITATPFLLHE